MCVRFEILHLRGFERGDDQQDCIGAHRARFEDLIRIDDEVLAQNGQRARGARIFQILCAALEELHVGEHGQTRRAMLRVRTRDVGGHEMLAQHAFRRARFLDLGDHGCEAGLMLRANRTDEIAQIARRRLQSQFFERRALLRDAHFFALDVDDAVQNVAHMNPVASLKPD